MSTREKRLWPFTGILPPWTSVVRSWASGNPVCRFPFDLNKRLPKALMGFPTNSEGIESRVTGESVDRSRTEPVSKGSGAGAFGLDGCLSGVALGDRHAKSWTSTLDGSPLGAAPSVECPSIEALPVSLREVRIGARGVSGGAWGASSGDVASREASLSFFCASGFFSPFIKIFVFLGRRRGA